MPYQRGPVFPPEIEDLIFSLAVQADWTTAKSLILVAKRVHHWIIPQIYNVVIFHDETPALSRPRYHSKHLEYHGQHVRHLLIFNHFPPTQTNLYDTPVECLKWCPNVTNLAIWITPTYFNRTVIKPLLRLPLTHLSLNFGLLKAQIPTPETTGSSTSSSLTDYSFPTVTHLEIINTSQFFTPTELKECFPNITHLAMNAATPWLGSMTPSILELWKDKMKMIILYQGESRMSSVPVVLKDSAATMYSTDRRVVMLEYGSGYVGTWYEGTRRGESIWRVAEKAIAKRSVEEDSSISSHAHV